MTVSSRSLGILSIVAGADLGGAISTVVHRIGGSVDDIATTFRRNTNEITGGLRGGSNTMVAWDRPTALSRLGNRDYDRTFLSRMVQPPVPRIKNAPGLIADELERIHRSGVKARWANYDPDLYRKGHRTFERALKSDGPLEPLDGNYGLNCWEMVCYAAARTGVVDNRYLRKLTELPRKPDGGWDTPFLMNIWLPRMGRWLIPEQRRFYTGAPGRARPQRGDIVMWNRDAEHVTVATGRTGKDGSPELYSFWYLPKYDLKWDDATQSYSQVVDAVQLTTVKELTDSMLSMRKPDGNLYHEPGTTFDVTFGRGPW